MELCGVFVRGVELALEVRRPCMCCRCVRELADLQGVHKDVCLMNGEVQYDRAVASMFVPHCDRVASGRTECIYLCRIRAV